MALVGYTNAGKSTLFNRLTGSTVYVANQLFATLDPTLRRIDFPEMGPVILADTVGFIRHLPHDLIEAFHATLEEVSEADLLLHVVDSQDQNRDTHIEEVDLVLDSINAKNVPRLMVYNKIDCSSSLAPKIERNQEGELKRIYLSAAKDQGLSLLVIAIGEILKTEIVEKEVVLPPQKGKCAPIYTKKSLFYQKKLMRRGIIISSSVCHE